LKAAAVQDWLLSREGRIIASTLSKRQDRGRRGIPNALRASKPVRTTGPLRAGDSAKDDADSFRSPLARLLDTPHFAGLVPHLAPETLHQLIRRSGLDACGELVAAATPGQLTSVLDLDLWRHAQPGRDEQFDADRFGEWLELLADTGGTAAARIVAALDEQLVIAGLSRYVRVFDPPAIAPPASIDDELTGLEVTPTGGLEYVVGGYLVCAIRADAWDAIVALLLALDADHRDCFHAVMRGCRRLSNSTPEADGLDRLLTEPEQLLHDVAVDRDQRRSRQGYSTPADARAFLQMARQRTGNRPNRTPPLNPIAAAYLRAADDAAAPAGDDASRLPRRALEPAPSADGTVPEALDAIVGLLAEAGLVPQQPRALLEGARPEQSRLTRIRPLMQYVREMDGTAHLARNRELAFLANTLMAGCSVQSRRFTAEEASDAVVGICNLGLEHWPARRHDAEPRDAASTAGLATALPDAFLVDHDLVTAFEVGWAVLHEDVSMFVAGHLIGTLRDLRCADATIQRGLRALRRELVKQHAAGTPWRAREALDVLAMLDLPAWASLLGLLDECPVMPAALTATLEGRTGAVSATAFEFISTTGQIGQVRAFMGRLLDALGR
jgi:hypothetical protein